MERISTGSIVMNNARQLMTIIIAIHVVLMVRRRVVQVLMLIQMTVLTTITQYLQLGHQTPLVLLPPKTLTSG